MTLLAEGSRLDGLALLLAVGLATYLVVLQPVVGGRNQRRFEREVRLDPGARLRRYRRTLLLEWALAASLLVVLAVAPDLDLTGVGVRWPQWGGAAAPYTVVGAAGLLLSTGLLVSLRRRVRHEQVRLSGPRPVLELLPRTVRERRAFLLLAVSAGVCEELLYRGFLLAGYAVLVPGATVWQAVAFGAVAFGVAHLYQGYGGMLVNSVLGGCLSILYLGSASLLLPALYHAMIDLRALVLTVPGRHRHAT